MKPHRSIMILQPRQVVAKPTSRQVGIPRAHGRGPTSPGRRRRNTASRLNRTRIPIPSALHLGSLHVRLSRKLLRTVASVRSVCWSAGRVGALRSSTHTLDDMLGIRPPRGPDSVQFRAQAPALRLSLGPLIGRQRRSARPASRGRALSQAAD